VIELIGRFRSGNTGLFGQTVGQPRLFHPVFMLAISTAGNAGGGRSMNAQAVEITRVAQNAANLIKM